MLDAFPVQKAATYFLYLGRITYKNNVHYFPLEKTTKALSTTYYEAPVQYFQCYLKTFLIHTEQEVSTETEQQLRRKRGYNATVSLDSLSAGATKGNWVSIIGNSQHLSSRGRTARFS